MVDIEFTGVSPRSGKPEYVYEDGEGYEYRYEVGENGALAVYEKSVSEGLPNNAQPIAVYGPSAWFSVRGDARSRADAPKAKIRSF